MDLIATSRAGEPRPERVRYHSEQLLTADDMTAEQDYFWRKLRRHNRFLHGWGVACGLEVTAAPTPEAPWRVCVSPGYAVSPQGDEILLDRPAPFDLAADWLQAQDPCTPYPCPPRGQMPAPGKEDPVFLAIRYAECDARPVRRLTHGCGCDDTDCDWSRIQDSWELALTWQLPDVYAAAAAADQAWRDAAQAAAAAGEPLPAPACPSAADEPWVVLARIVVPADRADPIATISPPLRLLLTAGTLDVLRHG